jgi:hypothetical protein
MQLDAFSLQNPRFVVQRDAPKCGPLSQAR